jgi:hypothetical protein
MIALGKSSVFASMILGSCLNPLAAQQVPPAMWLEFGAARSPVT